MAPPPTIPACFLRLGIRILGVCFQNLGLFNYMYMCTYLKKTRMKARMDTRRTVADKPTASPIILLVERPGGGGVVGVDENEGDCRLECSTGLG